MAKPPVSPFVVLTRELPAERTFEVTPAMVSEWVKGMPMREALGVADGDPEAGSGRAELELTIDDDHAFASGPFTGHLMVACSRCVGPVRLELDTDLNVTFVPKSELPDEDATTPEDADGNEIGASDLDIFPFDGETVDLEPLLREQFVLAIPYAPLCREDCKGLCGQCGIDRNTATCTCEKPMDPRLAALRDLKLPS